MDSVITKLRDVFVPSLVASATSVVLYKYYLGEDLKEEIPIISVPMPAYVTVGVASFAGSVAGQTISEILEPKLPNVLGNLQGMIIPPVVDGFTTYGAMVLLVHQHTSFKNSFTLGVGGSIVGQWFNNSIWHGKALY